MGKFGIEKLAEDIAQEICAEASSWAAEYDQKKYFGSPIETIFWLAIEYYVQCFPMGEIPFDDVHVRPSEAQDALIVEHQKTIIDWPVDFLIYPNAYPDKAIVVECDGHDFHERTKEQAARDRSRDRALQQRGYAIFRFTGSEIYRDPVKCAKEVLKKAAELFWQKRLQDMNLG